MSNNDLKLLISQNKVSEAVSYIERIGYEKNPHYVPILLEYLTTTEDKLIRNSIAIALADIGDEKAVIPLINMIQHPKTERCRGSLLYALEQLNYSSFVIELTEVMIHGNFEVSRHAFQLIENIISELSYTTKEKCKKLIMSAISTSKDTDSILLDLLNLME